MRLVDLLLTAMRFVVYAKKNVFDSKRIPSKISGKCSKLLFVVAMIDDPFGVQVLSASICMAVEHTYDTR